MARLSQKLLNIEYLKSMLNLDVMYNNFVPVFQFKFVIFYYFKRKKNSEIWIPFTIFSFYVYHYIY